MSLNRQQLKTKASELFTYFEFNQFNNELLYDRRVNLVLEFCDYICKKPDWELLELLTSRDPQDAVCFRQMINQGADFWLGDLVKTISF